MENVPEENANRGRLVSAGASLWGLPLLGRCGPSIAAGPHRLTTGDLGSLQQLPRRGSGPRKSSSSYTLVTKITMIKGSKRHEIASFSQFNYRTGGPI